MADPQASSTFSPKPINRSVQHDGLVISGLKRKQREIVGAIRTYEAQIAQAKHDLAHINAALKIVEGTDANKRTYIAGRGFFDKGDIGEIAIRHLADGPMNTRQIAE